MKYQLLIRKEIKTADDLPKGKGKLIYHLIGGGMAMGDIRLFSKEKITKYVDWYLQPVKIRLPSDKRIKRWANEVYDETNADGNKAFRKYAAMLGAKWLRDKILTQIKK